MSGTENPPTTTGPTAIPGDTAGGVVPAAPPSVTVDAGTQDPPTQPGPTAIPGDTAGPAINPTT